jgi:hypothetical protein
MSSNEACSEFLLTPEDWRIIQQTSTFLEPFFNVTKLCEGDNVTLDTVLYYMDYLVNHIETQHKTSDKNSALFTATLNCWYVFDKYWAIVDKMPAYVASILLHPSRRLSYLKKAWKPAWWRPSIELARSLYNDKYRHQNTRSPSPEITSTTLQSLHDWEAKMAIPTPEDEFDSFIKAPRTPLVKETALEWWQRSSQTSQYPDLSRMAIDILSIHASSADSERSFSSSKRTITSDRACLGSLTIEVNELLKSWSISGLFDASIYDVSMAIHEGDVASDDEASEALNH